MKLRYLFYGRLFMRTVIAVLFGLVYLYNPASLDFSSNDRWFGLNIFWMILMLDLLHRFIPGKWHPVGMQKHLKRLFIPTQQFAESGQLSEADKEQKKKLDSGARKVLIFYIFLNCLWLVLYCLKIIRPQEIFLIMLVYYVGDMICANGFCPFKLIFMRNRCCNVCRIYNWDAFMLVLPLLIVPSVYSYSLGTVAAVYTILWEVAYFKHPERFLEGCNAGISCKNCRHGMCPKRFPWNKQH